LALFVESEAGGDAFGQGGVPAPVGQFQRPPGGGGAGQWTGTVYWVRLDFAEGARKGEVIVLDQLSF
jgi:hypothetical protein